MPKTLVDVLLRDLNGNTVGAGLIHLDAAAPGQEFRVTEALLVDPGGTHCPGTLRLTIEFEWAEEEL